MVDCEGGVITRVDKTNNSGTTFTTDRETVAVTKCKIHVLSHLQHVLNTPSVFLDGSA